MVYRFDSEQNKYLCIVCTQKNRVILLCFDLFNIYENE